jgi:hypothetical protein
MCVKQRIIILTAAYHDTQALYDCFSSGRHIRQAQEEGAPSGILRSTFYLICNLGKVQVAN